MVVLGTHVATPVNVLRSSRGSQLPSTCAALLITLALPFVWDATTVFAQRVEASRLVGRTFIATVTSVVDGDTVHVSLPDRSTLTIRLDGIDTPERGEPFSNQARNASRVMLFMRRAEIRATNVDRYGRLVARVLANGTDVSIELVKRGLACHFTRYSNDTQLADAERTARKRGQGFWAADASKPSCAVDGRRVQGASNAEGPYHGNTSSRVFHAAWCKNYNCRNCKVVFRSAQEAEASGFKRAGDCLR